MTGIDWRRARAVIFDVDGTLYDQGPLRRRMLLELALHILRHPRDLGLVRILLEFRRTRERLADEEAGGIDRLQYERTAARLGVAPQRVRAAVAEWILERPLRHLRRCRFPGVETLFARLVENGATLAALSDYPAARKLAALGLEVDRAVSAFDPEVDRLKPHPAGLTRLLQALDRDPAECLLIGDRDERDGECARRCGVPYLLKSVRPAAPNEFRHYADLLAELPRAAGQKD